MQVEGTRMYRVKDVAEHFAVSVNTIYRAIESGRLGSLKLGAGRGALRVPGSAVRAYAETCWRTADDAAPGVLAAGGLTPAQVEGLACVVCGVDFLTSAASRWLVGRSGSGSRVFACEAHPAGGIRLTASGAYVDVINRVPEPTASEHIEACQRSAATAIARHSGWGATFPASVEPVGEVAR